MIIDATELKIQVPGALQKHSETYSTYKSHTTMKCLPGVDRKGGIMFISQPYEGAISDKQIVERSGFSEILRQKVTSGEIKKGDSIMADKGFDIPNDLKKLDLKLNIPPYLILKIRLDLKKMTSLKRRLWQGIEFMSIWSVACLLSNFQNPVLP